MSSLQGLAERCVEWLRRRTCLTIAVFCLLAFALFIVFSVANLFSEAHQLDHGVIEALRAPGGRASPLGGLAFQAFMVELTSFGDHIVIIVVILAASIYLLISERQILALLIAGAAASSALLAVALKAFFTRHGHDIVNDGTYHVVEVWADSFPSGHATVAASLYLTLGGLLATEQKTKSLKNFFIALALTLTIIVGVTRVYLGIHYPTDVFAGWSIGAALAAVWIAIAYRLRHGAGSFR